MPNTIAEYYTDELVDWNHAIIFYLNETGELTKKLGDVIRRNSIIGIIEKVEARQDMLNQVTGKFNRLQLEIERQEAGLRTDSIFVDNKLITNETESRQLNLRRNMQALEKEYIDVKFECYNFLSGSLKK